MLVDSKKVLDFHLHDALFCYLGHICVPTSECAKLIWEVHYSRVARHFGVEKNVAVQQRYYHYLKLQ